MPEDKCPYQKECATIIHWPKEKADFIHEVCNTKKYTECLHFFGSLHPQHKERERLHGDPHYGEPDWDAVAKQTI